jgi:hypothetical protein
MSRPILVLAFIAFALQSSQAQIFNHGIPASVVSPTPDGLTHGVPASVVSPTPLPFGVNPPLPSPVHIHGPLRRFGSPGLRKPVFVPVPIFYSYYTGTGYPSPADPYVMSDAAAPTEAAPAQQAAPDRREDELRAAYLQGARDAMVQKDDSRYGEHYLDSRERARREPAKDTKTTERSKRNEEVDAPPVEDKSPATVFIFKDGHQLETRNYAIMSGTLFDFSGRTLKKIELGEIDAAATVKANDDRGVAVKLQ